MPQRWRASREAMEMVIEQQRSAKSQRLSRSRVAGAVQSQARSPCRENARKAERVCKPQRPVMVSWRLVEAPAPRPFGVKSSGAKTLASTQPHTLARLAQCSGRRRIVQRAKAFVSTVFCTAETAFSSTSAPRGSPAAENKTGSGSDNYVAAPLPLPQKHG